MLVGLGETLLNIMILVGVYIISILNNYIIPEVLKVVI
jgi:hypothetical protein